MCVLLQRYRLRRDFLSWSGADTKRSESWEDQNQGGLDEMWDGMKLRMKFSWDKDYVPTYRLQYFYALNGKSREYDIHPACNRWNFTLFWASVFQFPGEWDLFYSIYVGRPRTWLILTIPRANGRLVISTNYFWLILTKMGSISHIQEL